MRLLADKNVIITMLAATLLLIISASNTAAQVITRTLTVDDPDAIMMINEFGGVIIGAGDTVKVEMVMPANNRADAYKTLDIEGGDIIKMVNGKALNSVKTLKELYETAAAGDIIKLGVIREGKPLMIKFAKANPDDQPQGMRMVVTESIDDSAPTSLVGIGIMLAVENGQIKISDVMKEIAPEFTGYTPHKDDIITELNGTKLESPDDLDRLYETIKPGEAVNLTLLHNGQKQQTSFVKPIEPGMRKIIRKTN
jgi:S1-C subfamily serine protease